MTENKNLSLMVMEANNLTQILIDNGGVLTPELENELTKVELQIAAKVDAYKFIMDKTDIERDYWKSKAALYTKMSKSFSNIKDRLKNNIKLGMLELDTQEIIGLDTRFKLSKAKLKLIIDENELPLTYCKEKIVYEPDKDKIRKDLEDNKEIKGARLENNFGLRSYPLRKELK